jgi:hypothetical protein
MKKKTIKKAEVFNPDHHDCCIEIGNCCLENPPKELIELLRGKPVSDCEAIIQEYLHPKGKLLIKWRRKIGFRIPGIDEN